jgi:putative ubiquitin-RnfH superfamily antitoxin RatB of RatAB toxin-antitoxin module
MAYGYGKRLNLWDARTGDPKEQEIGPPKNYVEATDRRAIRQAIMTQLLTEVAKEIIDSGMNVNGGLKKAYNQDKNKSPDKDRFRRLRALIIDPESEFNRTRDQLNVSRNFGSINLVVFRNAMAIGEKNVNPEEVARRVVIRAGRSGSYRKRGFAGCK